MALLALAGCSSTKHEHVDAGASTDGGGVHGSGAKKLRLCTGDPIKLDGPAGEAQSRGCVVEYEEETSDAALVQKLGAHTSKRRYLVYAPKDMPGTPVPVVFVFHGYGANAEAAAYYYTHTRFETLADRDGFVVVYGNGLPNMPDGESGAGKLEEGGYFQGCLLPHSGEGIDVQYVREILDQLETELSIDRKRVYATGLSAGGGLSFELALEAPDLVAAIAPVAGLPFQPKGIWLFNCHPSASVGTTSIAMLAATADPFIAYEPGHNMMYPMAMYPGMEQTRDAWLSAMGISAAATFESFPDIVKTDSYEPQSGATSSQIEVSKYPAGASGSELWYYKATGAGHWWPNPTQTDPSRWPTFGKTNQDVDFADQAWEFFQRHAR
jgi:polyhydroxybutyrate depolymerase